MIWCKYNNLGVHIIVSAVSISEYHLSGIQDRQAHAFLSIIGLPERSAKEAEDYVRIASEPAHDREKLTGF
jgi:hypothetical protein